MFSRDRTLFLSAPHGRAGRAAALLLPLALAACDAGDLGESGASEDSSESSGGAEAGEDGFDRGRGASGLGSGSEFTADGCVKWAGQIALSSAVDMHQCVEVQAGTYVLTAGVTLKPGHTLRGVSAAESILKAATTCNSAQPTYVPANR